MAHFFAGAANIIATGGGGFDGVGFFEGVEGTWVVFGGEEEVATALKGVFFGFGGGVGGVGVFEVVGGGVGAVALFFVDEGDVVENVGDRFDFVGFDKCSGGFSELFFAVEVGGLLDERVKGGLLFGCERFFLGFTLRDGQQEGVADQGDKDEPDAKDASQHDGSLSSEGVDEQRTSFAMLSRCYAAEYSVSSAGGRGGKAGQRGEIGTAWGDVTTACLGPR